MTLKKREFTPESGSVDTYGHSTTTTDNCTLYAAAAWTVAISDNEPSVISSPTALS